MKEFLTPSEVARILRVDDTTVRRWIKDGRIEAEVSGRKRPVYHIKRETVNAMLNQSSQNEEGAQP